MLFTYATARSLSSASVVAAGLPTRIPIIVYNGAFILRPDTREVLHSVSFTPGEAANIREILETHDISPLVYSLVEGEEKVSLDTCNLNAGKQRYLDSRKNDRRLRPLPGADGLYDGAPFYFTCIGEQEELAPVYEYFAQDARCHCTFQQELYRPEYWCEIMPARATKAHAVEQLKRLWNCDRVISFGDAVNDIPMFQISDECYAVENAAPALKELATGIIASSEEDGVADWLAEHVIL